MADSRRESALKALLTLLQGIAWTNAPAPQVERNEAEAREIPAGGLVSLRDGDPGSPRSTCRRRPTPSRTRPR